jgi:hypothetical protein
MHSKPVSLMQIMFFAVCGAMLAATACDVRPADQISKIDEITQPTQPSTAQDPPCHNKPSKKNSGQCPKPPGQEK